MLSNPYDFAYVIDISECVDPVSIKAVVGIPSKLVLKCSVDPG